MGWLILICKYITNQAETIKMLMHSDGFQKTYINAPLEQNSLVSMQYLKGSKYSEKMKRLGSVQLIQVKLPQKQIHLHLIRTTCNKLRSTMSRSRSLHQESERHHIKQNTTITQSRTKRTSTSQKTSKKERETTRQQQRRNKQENRKRSSSLHTTKP